MLISVETAAELLLKGDVVIIPTETVYGMAAKYDSVEAIKTIYCLKGRPETKALTVVVDSKDKVFAMLPYPIEDAKKLADAFWPGPLTMALPVKPNTILNEVTASTELCGFRIPNHPVVMEIVRRVGPIVLPSANLSGQPSCKTLLELELAFGNAVPIVLGNMGPVGIESTVLVFKQSKFYVSRKGAISLEALKKVLGYIPEPLEQ